MSFFFSSRRRHTRWPRDWSSDVCSSDLLVCDCYDKLGDKRGLHRYLQELLTHYPSSTLVIRIAEEIRWAEGDHAAADFIAQQLRQRPTIKALIRLIELHLLRSDGRARENLQLLKQLMERVLEAKPDYSCGQCGFTGNQLHWLCPGCKSWGTITAILAWRANNRISTGIAWWLSR